MTSQIILTSKGFSVIYSFGKVKLFLCFPSNFFLLFLLNVNFSFYFISMSSLFPLFHMAITIVMVAGYQFDYVFDWTILKYPQIASSSRGRVSLFCVLIQVCILYSLYLLYCISLFSSQWEDCR